MSHWFCSSLIEFNSVMLLKSVSGWLLFQGYKTLQAEVIPRGADRHGININEGGSTGCQPCGGGHTVLRDCTQTNTCDRRLPPDALDWSQHTITSFLQQGLLGANVSSTSPLTKHVSCSAATGKGVKVSCSKLPVASNKNVKPSMPLGRGYEVNHGTKCDLPVCVKLQWNNCSKQRATETF